MSQATAKVVYLKARDLVSSSRRMLAVQEASIASVLTKDRATNCPQMTVSGARREGFV